ncbi:MAG: peptidoglycan-binding domain-containing protein [Propionibacteriaceae bacterium]
MSTTTTPKSSTPIVAVIIAITAALISIVAVIALTFGSVTAHATPTTNSTTNAHSTSVVTHHKHAHTIKPTHHVTPAQPSTSVELLQTQLGQLNYYNGQPTGYYNHDTVEAIRYLQRDAHLPQTGQLNSATQQALDHMLATGNNQMGS